jgi:hypothetical protein
MPTMQQCYIGKSFGIPSLVERLVASQEGLCCMEVIVVAEEWTDARFVFSNQNVPFKKSRLAEFHPRYVSAVFLRDNPNSWLL